MIRKYKVVIEAEFEVDEDWRGKLDLTKIEPSGFLDLEELSAPYELSV